MGKELLPRNKKLRDRSVELRKNATLEENHIWYDFLQGYHLRFNRQRIIGNYIVDFYCAKANLVIEIDGAQHFEKANEEYDDIRTKYLNSLGIEVLRFTNKDIKNNFDAVCTLIDEKIRLKGPP